MSTIGYWYSPRPPCHWDLKSCPHRLTDTHHIRHAAAHQTIRTTSAAPPVSAILLRPRPSSPHDTWPPSLLDPTPPPSRNTKPRTTSTVSAPSSPVMAWLRPYLHGHRSLLTSSAHPLQGGFVIDRGVQGHHWWRWEVNSSESWLILS
jgi:hypothetical protein